MALYVIKRKYQIISYREDLEKEKKATKKLKQDKEEQIKTLTEKINNLQTNLENTKTEVSHLHK